MRRFLVDRENIENMNVVQPEVELEPPPNMVNEFNPNEIVHDLDRRKQINEYAPDVQDQARRVYILKSPMQPNLSTKRAFCGHDESSTSLNKGNFREMIDWVKSQNEQVRDAFDRGGKNCTMTCGGIQKELAICCAHEVTKVIMEELGDRQFSMLIDESRDISIKEQMAVMLRFLNGKGNVVE
ncbi:unnamed protein product [Lathyrus sativus]|nr:unnamed protein product [Lathyrus sativus]